MTAAMQRPVEVQRGAKVLLAIFWTICIFFNYPLGSEEGSLTVAHVAQAVLFVIAFAGWLRQPVMRRWRGRRFELVILALVIGYIAIRLFNSAGGLLFLRHFAKLMLLVITIFTYRMLDPRNELLKWASWFLPALYAVAVAVRLVVVLASGEDLASRLQMPPYSHEYVGIIAAYLLGLLLLGWDFRAPAESRLKYLTIAAVAGLGLLLSAVRGGLLAILVTLIAYTYFSARPRWQKLLLLGGFFIAISLLSVVYTFDTQGGDSRLDVRGFDTTLTGRTIVWIETFAALQSSWSNMLFGMGLGSVEIYAEEAGGWKFDVFNGLLTAWANFGLVGMAGYAYLLFLLFRRLKHSVTPAVKAVMLPLFFGFVASDMFDTRWQQTLIGWLVAYLFYLFSSSFSGFGRPPRQPQEAGASVPPLAPQPSYVKS